MSCKLHVKPCAMPSWIVFEGGEGAGKTSQMHRLHQEMLSQDFDVIQTRGSGSTPGGALIRKLIVEQHDGVEWGGMEELLLSTVNHLQTYKHIIKPALAAKKFILQDRWHESCYAYQGGGRDMTEQTIDAALELAFAGDVPHPKLTIWLNVEPKVGIARSMGRLTAQGSAEHRFEKMALEFHERVREAYRYRSETCAERFMVIDTNELNEEQVFAEVVNQLNLRFN